MFYKRESSTAKICALARAYHSKNYKTKIFDDYLAFSFISKRQYSDLKNVILTLMSEEKILYETTYRHNIARWLNDYISPIILPRSAFAEKRLIKFARKYKRIQYIILGAGLDTFSFRNKNVNIKVFELDHPNTQLYKKKRLEELKWLTPDNVHFVSVDFERENMHKLFEYKTFDKDLPTFFSILGVTYYLSHKTFAAMINTISSLTTSDKEIVIDYMNDDMCNIQSSRESNLPAITSILGEKMKPGFSFCDMEHILASNNFDITVNMTPRDIQKLYVNHEKYTLKPYRNVNILTAKYKK